MQKRDRDVVGGSAAAEGEILMQNDGAKQANASPLQEAPREGKRAAEDPSSMKERHPTGEGKPSKARRRYNH